MRKVICICLAMLLLTACGAPAGSTESTEPAWDGLYRAEIGGEQVVFAAWEQDGVPTSGDYYLTQDVVLEASVQVSGDLKLHLNGHNITAANGVSMGSLFVIPASSSMTVYDDPLPEDFSLEYDLEEYETADVDIPGGSITSSRSMNAKETVSTMFAVEGKLHVAGGHIDASSIDLEDRTNGVVAYVHDGGQMEISGGVITGGSTWSFKTEDDAQAETGETEQPAAVYGLGGAVYVDKGGACTVSGGYVWRGNAARGGNFYVAGDENRVGKLTITGGVILAGEATEVGGNICVDGELEMSGGLVDAGQSCGHGGNIYLTNKLIMTGGTLSRGACDINSVQAKRGGNLAVNGLYAAVKITGANIVDGTASCKETHGGNVAVFGYGAAEFEIGEGTVISGGKGHRGGNVYIGHFNGDVPAENMDYTFYRVTFSGGTTTYRGANLCVDTKNSDRRILVTLNDCNADVENAAEMSIAVGAGSPVISQCDVVINGGSWSGGGFNIYQDCTLTCNGVDLENCTAGGPGSYFENP